MNNIFNEWKQREIHKGKFFYSDGIIDSTSWNKADTKILFILKEAYQKKEVSGFGDLCNQIKNYHKASGRTFKPLGQWAYGIHGVMEDHSIYNFPKDSKEVNNALFSTALINIKKSNGYKKSKTSDLKKYLDNDWDLIRNQISTLNPNLIVCGNTWGLLKEKLVEPKLVSERILKAEGYTFVNFWHPSNRASNLMNYYALCGLILKALNHKKI